MWLIHVCIVKYNIQFLKVKKANIEDRIYYVKKLKIKY